MSLLAWRVICERLLRKTQQRNLSAGFTLIELLVVVIVIAALATIVLPAFLSRQNEARVQGVNTLVSSKVSVQMVTCAAAAGVVKAAAPSCSL